MIYFLKNGERLKIRVKRDLYELHVSFGILDYRFIGPKAVSSFFDGILPRSLDADLRPHTQSLAKALHFSDGSQLFDAPFGVDVALFKKLPAPQFYPSQKELRKLISGYLEQCRHLAISSPNKGLFQVRRHST
jgi:hypothetical protein